MTKRLVRIRRGALETVKVSSAPLTWHDKLKVYYAKAFAVCSELLAVGNIFAPTFDYLPAKHWLTAGLVILGATVTVMSREKRWIEGH